MKRTPALAFMAVFLIAIFFGIVLAILTTIDHLFGPITGIELLFYYMTSVFLTYLLLDKAAVHWGVRILDRLID